MFIKKLVPLILISFFLAMSAQAQLKTNLPVLQASARQADAQNRVLAARLLSLARQKGWPLVIHYQNRGAALLSGIGPNGLPLYTAANDNLISAATIGTSQLWPGGSSGLGLSGSSAVLKGRMAEWDEGIVLPTHVELAGRILQKDNPAATSVHSTHVAGTMIATGVNPSAKGMAFGAQQLITYDFNNDVAEMFTEAPTLLISNHSYGTVAGWNQNADEGNRWEFLGNPGDTADYKFGYYDEQSQAWDSMSYHAPEYLIVKAASNNRNVNGPPVGQPYFRPDASGNIVAAGNRPAGISSNNGYDIIPTYGTAKNILVLGAVNPIPAGYTQPSDVIMTDFSSWGPTDDGRIKPDLVADGLNVLSCSSSANDAYTILSGTSMASPAAAASAFLLQEYYAKLHAGAFMRSATLKGILIHTADEAGPAPGPDYQFGYGLIDMKNAAAVIGSNNTDQLIDENNLVSGNSFSLPVIASGKGPLIATICWTDPPGSVNSTNLLNNPAKKLVNDLDLRISGNGSTFLPWVLDRLHPANAATSGDDTLNNVEKIEIDNAVPGKTYTISVTHKGTLRNGQQAYSLIVSGAGGQTYCTSAASNPAGTRIDNVTIANINNTNPAGCTEYTDYSNKTIQLQGGQTVPFSIALSSCDGTVQPKVVKIYIDYNNNGSLADSGELAAVSTVLTGNASFTGNIQTPAGVKIGAATLMRIVAEETTDTSAVLPCGNYPNGETEDYRVQFVSLSNDAGVTALSDPLSSFCAGDSQRISIRISNFGTNAQVNIPVSIIIRSASDGTVTDSFSAICPDTIPALGNVIYTLQPSFQAQAGTTYVITSSTGLSTDQDPTNDQRNDTVTVSSGGATPSGSAEICSTAPATASLKSNGTDNNDVAQWYDSQSALIPIATGNKTTTTVIPSNKTYYLGLNENSQSLGPASKSQFPSGGYNFFQGNFVRFSSYVPLTINTARLYVGHGGQVTFIVADLGSIDSTNGSYTYFPISGNTVTVYPTTPNPQAGAVSGNNSSDTGAVFQLNLSVPTPGDHLLIVIADSIDQPTLFRNDAISANPYPFTLPGIMSITGNSVVNTSNTADTTLYQQYYYFFYDMKVRLNKCASPRVAVNATTPVAPVISLNSKVLTSNFSSGNQWYLNDTLIAGATNQTYSVTAPGFYTDVVTDSVGCALVSNVITYGIGSGINLSATPNPSDGQFKLQFYLSNTDNVEVTVVNSIGQRVYASTYPDFNGLFSQDINLGNVSAGIYFLKVRIGGKNYLEKLVIK
jgi:Subtilase family/GEVED domain/Secretion system C-terminal sorting domain